MGVPMIVRAEFCGCRARDGGGARVFCGSGRCDTHEIGRIDPDFFSSDRAATRGVRAPWCIGPAVSFSKSSLEPLGCELDVIVAAAQSAAILPTRRVAVRPRAWQGTVAGVPSIAHAKWRRAPPRDGGGTHEVADPAVLAAYEIGRANANILCADRAETRRAHAPWCIHRAESISERRDAASGRGVDGKVWSSAGRRPRPDATPPRGTGPGHVCGRWGRFGGCAGVCL